MIKKIVAILFFLFIGIYLVFAFIYADKEQDTLLCSDLELVNKDEINSGIITKEKIEDILNENNVNPVGKPSRMANLDSVERLLAHHPLVKNAECYFTPSGKLIIEITQKSPILRVKNNKGKDFFLDEQGNIIPHMRNYMAYLPIATGHISEQYAKEKLTPLANYIASDDFLNSQIEQIDVNPKGEISITPRVGNNTIFLGMPDNLEQKFDNLKTFYKKGLSVVGWNKYKTINIEIDNQVIGVRRK